MGTKIDVLVIGAGSIRVNSAYFLAERGIKVTLLDKDDVCSSTSCGNASLLFPSHSLPLSSPGVIPQGIK
ncbi:MAG: D-amino-acid dehydrogenase [Chloroflexi bacterium]|jgi:D-amino-acid dehydrogenase|nr:MAG: D-amino-acid dehydrogenase [Chloroflexota bacterium]